MRAVFRALPWLVVAALASGCGPTMLKPKGRLVNNGEPYRSGDDAITHLTFYAVDSGSQQTNSYPAEFNKSDGTFRVVGSDGNGLPPGKYRIAIMVLKHGDDVFKGGYSPTNTPFVREVTPATHEVVLDLAKPEG